jgi:hypothetical protein
MRICPLLGIGFDMNLGKISANCAREERTSKSMTIQNPKGVSDHHHLKQAVSNP